MKTATELFLQYITYPTDSREDSTTYPSTPEQLVLLQELLHQLQQLGLTAKQDAHGYVMGTLPTNQSGKQPAVCFIAHVDTSPAISGRNVKARVVPYQGGDIVLGDNPSVVLSPNDYPHLLDYVGQHLIVTDGTTLLGADDKAGVAEIMALLHWLVQHPDVPRPTVKVAFTPDEEVGCGVAYFDVAAFGADFGYTVDGGKLGEINYECFNAASGNIVINGRSIHPGDAYGKMINAVDVFSWFHSLLPQDQRPVNTRDYQGFYMVNHVDGDVEKVVAHYILRDHDAALLAQRKQTFLQAAKQINDHYGREVVCATVTDSYTNMKQGIMPHYHLIETAQAAFRQAGVTPFIQPIRGGTDGATLTAHGLPCPNLSTGGHNFHGRYEYIPQESLETMVQVLVNIVRSYVGFAL